MQAQSSTLAVIGVDIMGSAITRDRILAGFAVSGFDTDPARLPELVAIGSVSAASATQVARGAGIEPDRDRHES